MKHLLFGIKYVVTYPFKKKKTPLICGLVMHNNCNLRCRHCTIYDRPEHKLTYQECIAAIDSFYDEGGRTLYYEGGEPMLWNDGDHTLDDIIVYAKNKGYLSNIIYTNGTMPLVSKADTIFVSIDGLEATNDYLRGRGFTKIMNNINESDHPSIYLNYTINNYNKGVIADFCDYMSSVENIKGTFFYFHTPYYGRDELYIDMESKRKVLYELLELKGKYKILNSKAGLRSAINNDWKRPLDICRIYEGGTIYSCCRFNNEPELCRECGYLSYPEINQVLQLKPSSILNAIKYF